MRLVLILIVLTYLPCGLARAADISIDLQVVAQDQTVQVILKNTGNDPANNLNLSLELDTKIYQRFVTNYLKPGANLKSVFNVEMPKRDGSYPLIVNVSYLNEGKVLHLLNVSYFNLRRKEELNTYCDLKNISIRETTEIEISYDKTKHFRLILPAEILIEKTEETVQGKRFLLRNTLPEFNSNYAIYVVLETDSQLPVQGSKIYSARLITSNILVTNSFFSGNSIILFGLIGITLALVGVQRSKQYKWIVLTRWGFSLFIVSLLFIGSRTLHFSGKNYDYFFYYVADWLYFYMIAGNFFVLYWLIKPVPDQDKNWQLMLKIFALLPFTNQRMAYDNDLANLGFRSLIVKSFYIPLLCSWSINNLFHQWNLTKNFTWTFSNINAYLIAFFIFIDVVIFAFGYLTELPQLKNQIKSVEPTLLGWIVCLACYPPFNNFSFRWIDFPLNIEWSSVTGHSLNIIKAVIAGLWGIYLWASVALGFKASNLTNRGIVKTGPYRFVRHPAYTAKVSLWILSSFFLGEFNFFLVLTFVVVYALRAWTEERHLSLDPEYQEYKKLVCWRVFPRVF